MEDYVRLRDTLRNHSLLRTLLTAHLNALGTWETVPAPAPAPGPADPSAIDAAAQQQIQRQIQQARLEEELAGMNWINRVGFKMRLKMGRVYNRLHA